MIENSLQEGQIYTYQERRIKTPRNKFDAIKTRKRSGSVQSYSEDSGESCDPTYASSETPKKRQKVNTSPPGSNKKQNLDTDPKIDMCPNNWCTYFVGKGIIRVNSYFTSNGGTFQEYGLTTVQ